VKQTDIKTIYIGVEELKSAVVDFVKSKNKDLGTLIEDNELQMSLNNEGLIVRIAKEINGYNDDHEFIVNE
jgi:hypothetical protein